MQLTTTHKFDKLLLLILFMKQALAKEAASSYYDCYRPCIQQVVPRLEKSDASVATSQYLRCMGNCTLKPVLQEAKNEADFHCNGEPTQSFEATCLPLASTVTVDWVDVRNRVKGEVVIYPVIEWMPCAPAIDRMTGYVINLYLVPSVSDFGCYNFSISRQLSSTDSETPLSVLLPIYLPYKAHFGIQIIPLPLFYPQTPDANGEVQLLEVAAQAPSCEKINGNWSCNCVGHESDVLYPAPDVVVDGYTVVVRWKQMDPCFKVEDYVVQIYVSPGDKPIFRGVQLADNNTSTLAHTFSHVYEPPEGYELKTRLLIWAKPKDFQELFAYSEFAPVSIQDWKLLASDLKVKTFPLDSTIEVSFPAANSSYDIKNYNICLNSSSYGHCEVVAQPQEETHKVVKEFTKLNPGYYTVQVGDVRDTQREFVGERKMTKRRIVLDPKPSSTSTKPIDLWLVAVMAGIVGVLLIVVVAFFFAWKRGICGKLRVCLPAGVALRLDKQTAKRSIHFSFKSRSLLLVWQRDLRSAELDETHSDNIRHLAAFLSVVCGLDVILDLFEDRQVCEGISKWIQSAYDKAEFVVFICPHFDYTRPGQTAQSVRSLIGDFDRIYNYLENEIGVGEKRSKFITALLPYSDITCFEKAKYLKKMTSVYKLMNQIDDFFLHVQGRSKLSPDGKLDLQVVSKRGYIDTNEGRAIHEGFIKFQKLLKDHSLCVSNAGSEFDDESSASDNISESYEISPGISMETSSSDLTCPDCYRHQSTDEERGAPIMVNVINEILPPNPPDCNFHIRQQVLNVPPSFVSNPEEEILLINAESGNLPTSESHLVSSNESININPGDCIEKLESHEVETSPKNLNFIHSSTSVQSSSGSEGIITSQSSSSNPVIILPGNLHQAPSSEDSGFLSNTV
ncbi:uncharacterized protein LOC143464616 isoform X2 [Clavelina lepadiformis]|uniref:uncharacterized protein LOC143464616 isoform X2 n=1 Tax=Clavelina lepadiformis TaxID=159417 RepID=UPI0040429440